jgi:hypothetical protein
MRIGPQGDTSLMTNSTIEKVTIVIQEANIAIGGRSHWGTFPHTGTMDDV